MKKVKLLRTILFLIGSVIGIVLMSGCLSSNHTVQSSTDKLPTVYIHASTDINTDDPKQVVGFADYVFLAKVENITNTEYKFPVMIEKEGGGTKEVTQPYTNYSIKVINNIKGDLNLDTSIPIQKSGGLSKDGKEYILYDQDFLPEPGKFYIFNASAQPDGSLIVSGPKSNIEITSIEMDKNMSLTKDENNMTNQLQQTKEYTVYNDAYQNEIEKDRKRFSSRYEQ